MSLDDLLTRNAEWAAAQLHSDPAFFARHVQGQKPRLLWIGCSDSRVPAEQVLDAGPGELFIHRNVANIVAYNDINISAVIEYAVDALGVQDIVICGHDQCGGVAAACADDIRTGYIGDWLMITGWAKRWVDERLGDEKARMPRDQYLRLVVEENVRLQVKHLSHLSVIRSAWHKDPRVPRLHGWVYDLATGRIRVMVGGQTGEDRSPKVE
jgi:carbonic anhydrase